ncbi:Eco57I restriction-modification methylase domain-containing protein [Caloranaerobacter sp. DY30410]|uniref:Eco57I restriction-modification methylase domain-containing protein n=1 Tax=Caloranaerobacter sp. DY30410 TaxID=3238305 RepID=UPI003D033944
MKKLIKILEKMLDFYNGEINEDLLEDMILNSLILLILEELNAAKLFLKESEIKNIKNHDIYKMLKRDMTKEIIKSDYVIPIAYEYIISRKEKKEKYSIYYTPEWLVNYMVDRVITQYIKQRNNIDNLKILEPACGSGMFLLYIFDVFYKWYKEKTNLSSLEIVKRVVENILYGIDIDGKGIYLCKISLQIKVYKLIREKIDLKFNLYNVDFLKSNYIDNYKFSCVIGNPPYLENRRINKYYNKDYLKNNFLTAVGRFDIYSLFIEKAIKMLCDDGYLAFITPGNILSNNNFTPIRKIILDKTEIKEIVNLGSNIFDKVDMNMAIIFAKKSQNNLKRNKILCKNLKDSFNIKKDIFKNNYKIIDQAYYYNNLNYVFDIESSKETFELRQRIYSTNPYKINDLCEIVAGIATGNIRNKLLTYDGNKKGARKVLTGRDIKPYYYNWSGLYVITDKSIINKELGEYATFMREEFVFNPKILIRQTADRFICAYDEQKYYILNTLYSLIVRKQYRKDVFIKFILALLNSKLYSFLYRSLIMEEGKLFPQLKIFHVQQSPFKLISLSKQEEYVLLIDNIISLKKQLFENTYNEYDRYIKQIEIEYLVYKLDRLVYNLFNLSNYEIEEIERKMGKSPLIYSKNDLTDINNALKELNKCNDVIKISKKYKIHPSVLLNRNFF